VAAVAVAVLVLVELLLVSILAMDLLKFFGVPKVVDRDQVQLSIDLTRNQSNSLIELTLFF